MRPLLFLAMLTIVGCDGANQNVPEEVDQTFNSGMASQSLSEALPRREGIAVHAVCGPAAGQGLREDSDFSSFEPDGISEGRTIFYSAEGGSEANVVFRDAAGRYINATDEGGEVRVLSADRRMWVIAYPETGVVETHNFVMRDSQMIDLSTTNKPTILMFGPSARIFTANCFRP